MKGYAYRDKYGILHVVDDLDTAQGYAVGPIKEVDCDHAVGYLMVDGKEIFDYGNGEVYVGGNKESGVPLEESPIAELVKDVLAKIGL